MRARRRSASRRSPARGCCDRRSRPGCRRRRRRSRSDRPAPVRRTCRARRRPRAARRRSAGPTAATRVKPSSSARRSTSANRSRCRGAMTSSAPGAIERMRANARSTAESSGLHGAAGHEHHARRRHAEIAQHEFARPAVRDRHGRLQRIELEAAGDRDARRVGAKIDDAGAPTRRSACRSGRCRPAPCRNSGRTSR